MCQISLPEGLELIAFSWDQLPPGLARGVARALSIPAVRAAVQSRVKVVPRAMPITPSAAFEEDVERWDGLS